MTWPHDEIRSTLISNKYYCMRSFAGVLSVHLRPAGEGLGAEGAEGAESREPYRSRSRLPTVPASAFGTAPARPGAGGIVFVLNQRP